VKTAFVAMLDHLDLPSEGETGMKPLRRSIAHLVRRSLGERDWVEGQLMLGHRKLSTSDTYAPFDPGYLAQALRVMEEIVEAIENLCPGAFEPTFSPAGASDVDRDTGLAPE